MLMIEMFNESAVWHDEERKWESRNEHIVNLLNATIPRDINRVDVPFLIGGRQGYALEAARARLGSDIKVLKETEPDVPPDIPGVVY